MEEFDKYLVMAESERGHDGVMWGIPATGRTDTLREYLEAGAKTHLEHLEDLVFDEGEAGLRHAIEVLSDIASGDVGTGLTVKFDGKPAVIFGGDRFGIGTKRFFTKPAHSLEEIAEVYSDSPELAELFTGLFPLLARAVKDFRVYMGDMMFFPGLPKPVKDGEVRFKPNTIEYGVPLDTELGAKIEAADYGIVVHTVIDGGAKTQLPDVTGVFSDVPGLWIGSAAMGEKPSVGISADVEEIKRLTASLAKRQDYFKNVVAIGAKLKKFFIDETKSGKIGGQGVLRRIMDAIAAQYKTDKGAQKALAPMQSSDFRSWMGLLIHVYVLIARAKDKAVEALAGGNQIRTYVGDEKHSGEGFVATKGGKMAKLVDRQKFSRLNYLNWQDSFRMPLSHWMSYSEGGNAIAGSSRIPKEDAIRVAKAARDLIVSLGAKPDDVSPIGTAGKKDDSGDVDVAVAAKAFDPTGDKDRACEALEAALRSKGMEPVYNKGLRTVSVGMPFGDGLIAQVDFMVVPDLAWARFGYHTPASGEDVKWGMARNVMLYELVRAATRKESGDRATEYMFSTNDGFQLVERELDAKGKWRVVKRGDKSYDMSHLIEVLANNGVKTSLSELETLTGVIAAARRELGDAAAAEMAKRTIRGLESNRKPVPPALQKLAEGNEMGRIDEIFDRYVAMVAEDNITTNIEFFVKDKNIFVRMNNQEPVALADFMRRNATIWNIVADKIAGTDAGADKAAVAKAAVQKINERFAADRSPWDIIINNAGQIKFNQDT